jgi:branched-chain amino acid transport system ATP-binding protein
MDPVLKIEALNAFYGDLQVLYGININVWESEIVSLVGSNAAGKSTLINTISGMVEKKEGFIYFNRLRIDSMPAHKIAELQLTQVPEARRLFPYMTVKENLIMGGYIRKARPHISERMQNVFQLLPILEERQKQLAGSLSGGEQQMSAIGRGLMAGPKLLMLDEPTLGLAPLMVEKIFQLVQTIKASGITVLIVEQNVQNSLEIANRAYVLENGKIVMEGIGSELLTDDSLRKSYMGI